MTGRALRILLVDDDVDSRYLLGLALERFGFMVVHAGTVAEALAHLRRADARADVVIVDVILPDGSGAEVAHAAHPLPVLALTGFSGALAMQDFRARLLKPVDVRRLVKEIRRLHEESAHTAA